MSLTSNLFEKKLIDEQEMVFPSSEQWKIFFQTMKIDGEAQNKAALEFCQRRLGDVAKYPELSLALSYIDNHMKWFTYIILKIGNDYQRIFLERVTCSYCKWGGLIANPFVEDNYIGLPKHLNKFQLMNIAEKKYPEIPCPICKNKLPRPAIWIEH